MIIKRYALPPMQELWLREETKFEHWLEVELAVLRAREQLGLAPQHALRDISRHAGFTVQRIDEIDAEIHHDMIAFITAVHETLEAAGIGHLNVQFHREITSYDIEDPALILMLRKAVKLDLGALGLLDQALQQKAMEHKWTWMIMRTHGQYAEPSTFGHLLLVFAEEVRRCIARLRIVLEFDLAEGKVSGAVGSYAGLNPDVEKHALRHLGLTPALAETQILQRDRHASLVTTLAICGGVFEQIAKTFWVMMRSEVQELREPRKKKQKGSSAMPWKKNPILTEQFMGMPRMLRADAMCALEDIGTFEGREISQSNVERHIFGRATTIVHYMATKLAVMVENLEVFPDKMLHRLTHESLGVWAGQRVRHALEDAGLDYETAYRLIQACSFKANDDRTHLSVELARMPISEMVKGNEDTRTASDILGQEELQAFFDHEAYARAGIEYIFTRQAT
ncbi:adenylosuccinate lyase [Patescibacteria group bacterium]|nr:adenylosuccinate lyase [Patescibacteria group bacterium]MBU1075471.1 adenylosuccinate lyase [Patescibacteria group bacterium]MBU1951576.1 adenylosuccinate lyase [Patescibacteria group bacterium]